jgi:hypothetical protein
MFAWDMWVWDMWEQDFGHKIHMLARDMLAQKCGTRLSSMHGRAYIQVDLKFGGPTGPTKGVQGAKPPASCESVL